MKDAMDELETRTSERFCAPDADVIFRSGDGVLFHIHRKHLEVCTGGFPPGEIATGGEIVPLPETAATLELLFQFIYPARHPNLKTTEIEVLAPLAEAAEKYEVFAAMSICEVQMRNFTQINPAEVLAYAARHAYYDMLSDAATAAIKLPLDEVVMSLPQNLVVPWVRFHAQYTSLLSSAAQTSYRCDCTSYYESNKFHRGWESISLILFRKLALGGVGALEMELDRAFAGCSDLANSCCVEQLKEWRERVGREKGEILGFEAFL